MVTHMESLMAHGDILVPLVASRVIDLAQTGSQHIAVRVYQEKYIFCLWFD